jgi:hypothetical protein
VGVHIVLIRQCGESLQFHRVRGPTPRGLCPVISTLRRIDIFQRFKRFRTGFIRPYGDVAREVEIFPVEVELQVPPGDGAADDVCAYLYGVVVGMYCDGVVALGTNT